MNYSIESLPFFDKQLKRLVKKYPSLKNEFAKLIQTLSNEPKTGTSLGHDCYKIRLAIASKRKGKSGGARVITYVQVVNTTIYLLTVYDKSEQENLTESELKNLVAHIPK